MKAEESKAQKRLQDLVLSKKSFYVKRSEFEKIAEENTKNKSRVLVANARIEVLKSQLKGSSEDCCNTFKQMQEKEIESLKSQLEKGRALTIGESFAIEDENSIQYFVQGIDGLKSSMIHTKLKPITSNPK